MARAHGHAFVVEQGGHVVGMHAFDQERQHRGTLSGVIRRLEAAGYVERTVDARDARRAGLTLTAAGRTVNRRRAGTFEDAAADTARNWQAHRILADHYLSRGDYRRTLDHCRRGLACGREQAKFLGTYGRALFETGSRDQAIGHLREAVRLAPGSLQKAEELQLRLVQLRKREARGAQELDDLFGVRFVNDKGEYEECG